MVNVYPVQAVPDGAGFIEHHGGRKRKVLAQLRRIDGVRKGVVQLSPRVRAPPVGVPLLGRAVSLGQ